MRLRLLFFAIIIILQSCSSVNITSDWDREANFNDYKTFNILSRDSANQVIINDFDWKRIKDAIITEMTARGYTHQPDNGDLDVGIHILLQDKTDIRAYTDYYGGYGYGSYRWGYGYGPYGGMGGSTTTITEYDYTQGTLILNIMDAKEKSLLYQGIAVGTVKEGNSDREKRVNKVMTQVFAPYPVPKAK